MSCPICHRFSCTRSFHSLDDQRRFDEREAMSDDVNTLRAQLQEALEEIEQMKEEARDAAIERDLADNSN